jgi:hypothetical protein
MREAAISATKSASGHFGAGGGGGAVLEIHTQVVRQVSQQRQTADLPKSGDCFPPYSPSRYDNLYMKYETSYIHGVASRLGLAFSPLAFQVTGGRRYLRMPADAKKPALVMTLGESLLMDQKYVYGPYEQKTRETCDFLSLFCRLLCGAVLDIGEQLALVNSLPPPRSYSLRYFHTVLRCLWTLRRIELPAGQILQALADLDSPPGGVEALLESFKETHLGNDEDLLYCIFRNRRVVQFLVAEGGSGSEQSLRESIKHAIKPLVDVVIAQVGDVAKKSPEGLVVDKIAPMAKQKSETMDSTGDDRTPPANRPPDIMGLTGPDAGDEDKDKKLSLPSGYKKSSSRKPDIVNSTGDDGTDSSRKRPRVTESFRICRRCCREKKTDIYKRFEMGI